MNLCFPNLISKGSYLNTFEGRRIFHEMLVLFGKNRNLCKFPSLVPSCHHALQTASFLLLGLHPGDMASAFVAVLPFLSCCRSMFGSSSFSLKSSLWLSFVSGRSSCFLYSSLVSARIFPDLVDLTIDSYIPILSCSFWSHPPVLWDILVPCGWGYSLSLLTSEKCQSLYSVFSEYATTRGSLWGRQESSPAAQICSQI